MLNRATDPVALALLSLLADAHTEHMGACITRYAFFASSTAAVPQETRDASVALGIAADWLVGEIAGYIGAGYEPCCSTGDIDSDSKEPLHAACTEARRALQRRAQVAIGAARVTMRALDERRSLPATLAHLDEPGAERLAESD